MSYIDLKNLAIKVVDDLTRLDIAEHYGTDYTAATKLDSIRLTEPVRKIMPKHANDVFGEKYGDNWRGVRSIDTVKCESIGDFIKLAAAHADETIPLDEPR